MRELVKENGDQKKNIYIKGQRDKRMETFQDRYRNHRRCNKTVSIHKMESQDTSEME